MDINKIIWDAFKERAGHYEQTRHRGPLRINDIMFFPAPIDPKGVRVSGLDALYSEVSSRAADRFLSTVKQETTDSGTVLRRYFTYCEVPFYEECAEQQATPEDARSVVAAEVVRFLRDVGFDEASKEVEREYGL